MKRFTLTILTFFFLLGINSTFAQKSDIVINEIIEYMSQGEKTGFEVAIVDADPKDVESSWAKYLKKYKAKVISSKKSVEIFGDNAAIPQISSNTIDVYAIARKTEYGTKLSVFFDLGGAFISSQDHEVAFGAAEGFLRDFALSEAIRVVEAELKTQEKVFKDLTKELDGMIKDKDGYVKEIEKAKALIAQREQDIMNNEAAQETKRQQIAIQEEIVNTVKQKRTELDH
ncbi:MAG: hypothetical protein R2728_03350 [Chitinophagales bacterium]